MDSNCKYVAYNPETPKISLAWRYLLIGRGRSKRGIFTMERSPYIVYDEMTLLERLHEHGRGAFGCRRLYFPVAIVLPGRCSGAPPRF